MGIISAESKKPHITGIKRQARYDPGVPMTRTELTAWRKEARRVRNRESAAESRRRTRSRIEELEAKLSTMENKYEIALKRISELESLKSRDDGIMRNSPQTPRTVESLPKEETPCVETSVVSPSISPVSSPVYDPSLIDIEGSHINHITQVNVQCQHINMISRPTAVKISGASTLPFTSVCDETMEPLTESTGEDFDGEMRDFLLDALVSDISEEPSGDRIEEDHSDLFEVDPLCVL